ncbi:MAG: hypothetical protein VX278_15405 [Myxococcota bacterium]|nr:hypothetical protein [Myxococcota bacterium]
MQHDQLSSLIQRLYTGLPNGAEDMLDPRTSFRDPVVIVKGRGAVLAMFQKLNRMFPCTDVKQFLRIEEDELRWHLSVQYGTKPNGRVHLFHTELEIEYTVDGKIMRITEHWLSPLNMRGNGQNPFLRMGRRFLGLGVGIGGSSREH